MLGTFLQAGKSCLTTSACPDLHHLIPGGHCVFSLQGWLWIAVCPFVTLEVPAHGEQACVGYWLCRPDPQLVPLFHGSPLWDPCLVDDTFCVLPILLHLLHALHPCRYSDGRRRAWDGVIPFPPCYSLPPSHPSGCVKTKLRAGKKPSLHVLPI